MKIREEDFDINEGLERYKNDKQIENDEKYLLDDYLALLNLVKDVIKKEEGLTITGISSVDKVSLKGDYSGKFTRISAIEDYPEGSISFVARFNNSEEVTSIDISWHNDGSFYISMGSSWTEEAG